MEQNIINILVSFIYSFATFLLKEEIKKNNIISNIDKQ